MVVVPAAVESGEGKTLVDLTNMRFAVIHTCAQ